MNQTADMDLGLWELAVLALLREHAMHPYEIQRLLRERKKDDVLVLKRGSLYHAIRRLEANRLIAEGETSRAGLRPERTTYSLTPAGEAALDRSLRDLVATPRVEPSSFMGAMSFLVHLEPGAAIAALEERVGALDREIAGFDTRIATVSARIGRIHVVESEYARAMLMAQAKWARALLADLKSGTLTWDLPALLRQLKAVHAARAKPARRRARKTPAR